MEHSTISRERWQTLSNPRGIAIIGASERGGPNSFAARFTANNVQLGYPGAVHYVNPNYESILGAPCYPDVASIPGPVDVCIVNLPSHLVVEAVRDAVVAGVKAFVVQSADFAEGGEEGRVRQEALRGLCADAGVTLIGPNCLGYVHFQGSAAVFGAAVPQDIKRGKVAAICGSGSVAVNFMRLGLEVGLHSVFSTGNEAVTSAEDVLAHLIDDPDVGVIAMFAETLRRPELFRELASRAHAADKPIIVLKSGVTDSGAKAAQSHTGALVGSGETYAAFFRQLGVVQVADFDELREAVRLFAFARRNPLKAAGVGLLSVSGGKVTVAADIAESYDVVLPQLSEKTLDDLAVALSLPPELRSNNPVDMGVGFRGKQPLNETIAACMRAVASDPEVGVLVLAQNLGDDIAGPNALEKVVIGAIVDGAKGLEVPVVLASDEGGRTSLEAVESATTEHTVAVRGLSPAFSAVAGLVRWYTAGPDTAPAPTDTGRRERVRQRTGELNGLLDPLETTWLLQQYEIPAVEPIVVAGRSELEALDLQYPVVAKVVSAEIAHKSDVGGVVLGIRNLQELTDAWDQIGRSVALAQPDAFIEGIQIAPMVTGTELFMGSHVVPGIGPVVAVGLGGTLVELLERPSLLLAPFDAEAARHALSSMPGAAVLQGFRGAAPADIGQLARTLCSLGALALDLSDRLESVDLNPVQVGASSPGGIAVDVRITLKPADTEPAHAADRPEPATATATAGL